MSDADLRRENIDLHQDLAKAREDVLLARMEISEQTCRRLAIQDSCDRYVSALGQIRDSFRDTPAADIAQRALDPHGMELASV